MNDQSTTAAPAAPQATSQAAAPAAATPFGHHRPSPAFERLIASAQRAPNNWFGQQFAQVVRRLVLQRSPLPLDVEIGPVRMRCWLRDNNSEKKFVFMPWRFDGRERASLLLALPPDGIFVDIGANVGIYSLTAATHLGAAGRVIAFEPNPPALARLHFNLEATRAGRTRWPQVQVLPIGVSDRDGHFELHLDPRNLGSSSLTVERHVTEPVRVACRPLKDVLDELGVARVDALKIDIEGAEDTALMPFLAQAPDNLLPRWVCIENSERLWKRDLPGAFRKRGYRVDFRTRMNTVYRRG